VKAEKRAIQQAPVTTNRRSSPAGVLELRLALRAAWPVALAPLGPLSGLFRAHARVEGMTYQLTLKRLLISVTLFAVAFALVRMMWYSPPTGWTDLRALIASGCIGGAVDLLISRRKCVQQARDKISS